MKKILGLIFFSLFLSCQNSDEQDELKITKKYTSNMPLLEGTKWQFKIADDCTNYFLFKADSNSIYYSCETEDKSYGKYFVKEDTLYIHEFVTDRDSLLSSIESEHSSEQAKYKLVLKEGKLKHIERWSYRASKDIWTKDDTPFGEDFLFEKVE